MIASVRRGQTHTRPSQTQCGDGAAAHSEDGQPRGGGALSVFQIMVTLGGIQVATMAFNVLRSKIVAMTGGPAGVGVISVVDQVVGLVAQVSTFSLPYASVKFLSAAHSEGREAFARKYLAFLRVLLITSLSGAAIGIVAVVWRPGVLGAELADYGIVVVLGMLAIPATNLTALLISATAAAQRVRASALFGLMTAIGLAVACTAGILAGGLKGYYVGNLIATLALTIGGMVYLIRTEAIHSNGRRTSVASEIKSNPQVLAFAGALLLTSFTTPLAYFVARYALLRSVGFEGAGLLQAAMGLGVALRTVMRSSNALFLTPAMNRRAEKHEKLAGAAQFHRALAITLGLLALPMVLFPDWLLFLLYSREFVAAAPYVYVFVLGESLQLFAGVNNALVIGLDHIASYVAISVGGDIIVMALALSLVPQFGIAGVALASVANGVFVFSFTAWRLWSSHRMAIHREMGWLPFTSVGIVAIAGVLFGRSSPHSGLAVLFRLLFWLAATLFLLKLMSDMEGGLIQRLRSALGLRTT